MKLLVKLVLAMLLLAWCAPLVLAPLFAVMAIALPNLGRGIQNSVGPLGAAVPGVVLSPLAPLVLVALTIVIVLVLFRLLRREPQGSSQRTRAAHAEETQIMQEIHRGLAGLDRRVESLETLLLSSARTKR